MISSLLDALKQVGFDLNSEEIADILWLALQMQSASSAPSENQLEDDIPGQPEHQEPGAVMKDASRVHTSGYKPKQQTVSPTHRPPSEPQAGLYASASNRATIGQLQGSLSFKVPAAASLQNPLQLARALRPLMRRIPSPTETVLDEVATAERIAEENICVPVLKPAPETWFDLALIADESPSMGIWRQTILDLQRLLERHGAFRHVQTWGLVTNARGKIQVRAGVGAAARNRRFHSPDELVDPSGRRLFLVVSDCVSPLWRSGVMATVLKSWSRSGPLAIVQMLPEQLWERTALGLSAAVRLRSQSPGLPNHKLIAEGLASWDPVNLTEALKIPVLTLEPASLAAWAKLVIGIGTARTAGCVVELLPTIVPLPAPAATSPVSSLPAEQRLHRFLNVASPIARKLAGLLAAAPVINLQIVRLIQRTMLQQSRQVHVAEVFLGGILKPLEAIDLHTDPDTVQYEFIDPEVRSLLLDASPLTNSTTVLREISDFVAKRAGLTLQEFLALLQDPTLPQFSVLGEQMQPFAMVTAQVLRRLGGEYVQAAEQLEQRFDSSTPVDEATISEVSPETTSTDGFAPRHITATLLQTLEGHTSPVLSVAFSPDGQTIASGSADHTIRLWRVNSNPTEQSFAGDPDAANFVTSSSGGRTIRLLDLEDNPTAVEFWGHTDFVYSVAFSPDGQTIVSGSADNTLRLWDLNGNAIGQPLQGHTNTVLSVAVSPDGQTIVSGSADNTVRLWSSDGILLNTLEGHTNDVNSVAFGPNGQTIASGSDDKTIRVWSSDGTLLHTLEGHTRPVTSVAFSPDGQTIVSGSWDRTVRLWSSDGILLNTLEGHTNDVTSVAFSPNGQTIVSGSNDNTVRLWSSDGTLLKTFQSHIAWITSIAFSPDGQTLASGSLDNTVRLWRLSEVSGDKPSSPDPVPPPSTSHALLIGIDYYPDNSLYRSLDCCVRGVELMRDWLQHQMGVPPEHIQTLTAALNGEPTDLEGHWPTYENIVASFQRLTEGANPGDEVFIYYAGHGDRVPTLFPELKGESGFDTVLVPTNVSLTGEHYLRDVELVTLLTRMLDKGLVVTIVLDSSFSGGLLNRFYTNSPSFWNVGIDFGTSFSNITLAQQEITTQQAFVVPSGFNSTDRSIESLVAPMEELIANWRIANQPREPGSFVVFAACQPEEQAYELAQGVLPEMTYWLLDSLKQMDSQTSYQELYDRVAARVHSQRPNQTPMLLGDSDRFVFGSHPTFITSILRVESNDRIVLAAGAANGLQVGAEFAIYPQNTHEFTHTEERLAFAQVIDLGTTESICQVEPVTTMMSTLELGSPAVLLPEPINLVKTVFLQSWTIAPESVDDRGEEYVYGAIAEYKAQQEETCNTLAAYLSSTGWFEVLREERDFYDYFSVSTEQPTTDYRVRFNSQNNFEICDHRGIAFPNIQPTRDPGVITNRLLHLAKYHLIEDLNNQDPFSSLRGKLQLKWMGLPSVYELGAPVPSVAELVPLDDPFAPTVQENQMIGLYLYNGSTKTLNIKILNLSADWSIQAIYPVNLEPLILSPEEHQVIPIRLQIPSSYRETEVIIKVLATLGAADLPGLELPSLNDSSYSEEFVNREIFWPESLGDPLAELSAVLSEENLSVSTLNPAKYLKDWTTRYLRVKLVYSHG